MKREIERLLETSKILTAEMDAIWVKLQRCIQQSKVALEYPRLLPATPPKDRPRLA